MGTEAELRKMRIADKEKRKAEWEARQAERAKKTAEWEATQAKRQEAREARTQAARGIKKVGDTGSVTSGETESTAAPVVVIDHDEARRMGAQDKQVRKLEKLLREIEKLESLSELDNLQKVKIARKPAVALELDTARGLAESRARDVLRQLAV